MRKNDTETEGDWRYVIPVRGGYRTRSGLRRLGGYRLRWLLCGKSPSKVDHYALDLKDVVGVCTVVWLKLGHWGGRFGRNSVAESERKLELGLCDSGEGLFRHGGAVLDLFQISLPVPVINKEKPKCCCYTLFTCFLLVTYYIKKRLVYEIG